MRSADSGIFALKIGDAAARRMPRDFTKGDGREPIAALSSDGVLRRGDPRRSCGALLVAARRIKRKASERHANIIRKLSLIWRNLCREARERTTPARLNAQGKISTQNEVEASLEEENGRTRLCARNRLRSPQSPAHDRRPDEEDEGSKQYDGPKTFGHGDSL